MVWIIVGRSRSAGVTLDWRAQWRIATRESPLCAGLLEYRYGDSKSASGPVEYGFSLLSLGFVPLAGG